MLRSFERLVNCAEPRVCYSNSPQLAPNVKTKYFECGTYANILIDENSGTQKQTSKSGHGLRVGDLDKVVNVMHAGLEQQSLDHKQQQYSNENQTNANQPFESHTNTNQHNNDSNKNQALFKPSHSGSLLPSRFRDSTSSTPKPSFNNTQLKEQQQQKGRRNRYSRQPSSSRPQKATKHPWFNGVIDSDSDDDDDDDGTFSISPTTTKPNNLKYPAALHAKWASMAGKGSPETLYALANEIANTRLKARKTASDVKAATERRQAKIRLANGPKVKISACSLSDPLATGSKTSTGGKSARSGRSGGGGGGGAGGSSGATSALKKRRYYFQGYTGLSMSMEPETRIARINSRQRYPILDYKVVTGKSSLAGPAKMPGPAAAAAAVVVSAAAPPAPESRLSCHTSQSSYTLMRSACALYLNKTVQGYGKTLPRGQLMAQLILLNNKKGAAVGMLGGNGEKEEARPKWAAAAGAAVMATKKKTKTKKRTSMLNWA